MSRFRTNVVSGVRSATMTRANIRQGEPEAGAFKGYSYSKSTGNQGRFHVDEFR